MPCLARLRFARKCHSPRSLQKEHRTLLRTHEQLEGLFEQADAERVRLLSLRREREAPLAERSGSEGQRTRGAVRATITRVASPSSEAAVKHSAATREGVSGSAWLGSAGAFARGTESEIVQSHEAAAGEGPQAADSEEGSGRRKAPTSSTSANHRCSALRQARKLAKHASGADVHSCMRVA